MTDPFVYVGTWAIKPGALETARERLAEHAEFVEKNEPRMVAFQLYFDAGASRASVVQVHPDAGSMEFHMRLIAEHAGGAFDYIDRILSEQYYGPMSDTLAATLERWESPGVAVVKMPVYAGGFTRSSATR